MSRSFRHRHWIHPDVYEDFDLLSYDDGGSHYTYFILEGNELKKAIRTWRSYKPHHYLIARCPMRFRREHQKKYRVECRKELQLFNHDPEHEVMIDRKMKLPYWD